MSRQAPPVSPLSMSSNDSSFVGRYGSISGQGGLQSSGNIGAGTPNDVPYSGGPYGVTRPPQSSPPSSQHPSSSTDMSRPSVGGSSVNGNRPPSSASSVGMSSDGRMGFGKPQNRDRESTRSHIRPEGEDALSRHYGALKQYLQVHLQDEKGNIKPNRARDKLLRLSVTQFMELSTDVYDELIRREDERLQRVDNVPRYLLPKQNFHPKRNQARQKLSTLPIERFRQLATDVFYELERRIPRFAGGGMERPRSGASNSSSRSRATSRGGMRPPGPGYGPPFPPGAGRGRGYPGPYGGPGPNGMPPGPRRPSEAGSLGRPLPKHFQSSTIVPNKGTMVEDDDLEDDEDAFGLDHVGNNLSQRPSITNQASSEEDKALIQAQAAELADLQSKIGEVEQKYADAVKREADLQNKLQLLMSKSTEVDDVRALHQTEIEEMREQLDELNHNELPMLRAACRDREQEVEELRVQLHEVPKHDDELKLLRVQLETHQAENDGLRRHLDERDESNSVELEHRVQVLEEQLSRQEEINAQVQKAAMESLREMQAISRENDDRIEQEEQMAAKIAQLQEENNVWRQRYAKVKAQNKHLRASTMGLGLQTGIDTGSLVRSEGLISEGGLVRDTDVTRFQLAVDELLKAARSTSNDSITEAVKHVAFSVQAITSCVRDDGYPTPSPSPLSPDTNLQPAPAASVNKLKNLVNGTANSLITASKQHANSHGLSPVALLDAAASNLTASVVELIKAVHIKPSKRSDFNDLEAADDISSFYNDSLSPIHGQDGLTLQVPAPASENKASNSDSSEKSSNGAWFGWAGRWPAVEDSPASDRAPGHNAQRPSQHRPQGSAGSSDVARSDYDPYR